MNKDPSESANGSPQGAASTVKKRKSESKRRKTKEYYTRLRLKNQTKKAELKARKKSKKLEMKRLKAELKAAASKEETPTTDSASTVGLLRCLSPWLRRDNVCLGLLLHNSVLTFTGCVQVRVLAGLLHCNGHILKPSPSYHSLYSPHNHPHLSFSPMDPQIQDEEFESYLAPFRDWENLHFHSVSEQSPDTPKEEKDVECKGHGCLHVDIGVEDVRHLNQFVKRDWNKMTALVLLRAVGGDTVPLINYWTQPTPILSVSPQVIDGFKTVAKTQELKVPPSYMQVAWEIASVEGVRVLVCGEGNSGKSTLCRFLINYMLNRYPYVCYLECDPGQPEFTVPEVLSLHTVTDPLLGPPYTHLRKPYKAYYYGDKTPQADPEYYLSLLKALHDQYAGDVCSSDSTIPLVVNTCGWIKNQGVQLFLNIVRMVRPSHIVRTVSSEVALPEDLPPLTPEFLNSTPGLFRTTDVAPFTEAPSNQSAATPGDSDDDVVMYASSDELLSLSDKSSNDLSGSSSSDEGSSNSDQSQSLNSDSELPSDSEQKRRHKRKRLKLSGASFAIHHGSGSANLVKGVSLENLIGRGWLDSTPYRVFYLKQPGNKTAKKRSREMRRLGYVSYFSGLLPLAEEVAKQHRLPDPHGNMLQYAPPLEIPWKDVAVHICFRNVPNCQSLYALNGKIVALGRVDSKEFSEKDLSHPDMPRFLKSDTPLIEFIGLGVVRGIDMDRGLFYLTSPECTSTPSLTRVNVIALGNPDQLDFFSVQEGESCVVRDCPYSVHGYQSLLGMYSWTTS